MSEEKQSECNEMDVSSDRKKSNVEKAETEDKISFEVEEPEEVPITKETVEAEVEELTEPEVVEEKQTIEELDGIETKGAEKRIRQLVQQRKDRDDHIVQQNQELTKLRTELLNSQNTTQNMEVSSLSSK